MTHASGIISPFNSLYNREYCFLNNQIILLCYNNLDDDFQLAYWIFNSMKPALIKKVNDILEIIDNISALS